MVIHNFNIIGIAVFPFKTNTPLPIYADAALAGAVAAQRLKPVAGQGHKVLDGFCVVQNFQIRRGQPGSWLLSFASPKESSQRKRDPGSLPLRGALCCSPKRAAAQLALCAQTVL